ncbi:hypothetical protein G7Z17_g11148 [Cylindrodendrum hubeiense]|uniref:Uncharacterized protein n=1 Tax=Cylindrodendrum hubeiense TaxID=595255 RepID=A0A9P5H5Q4_9HYPO|nr:hypothetical protein G7Z17_g11148 [Cylindrodendrum hubeiense]
MCDFEEFRFTCDHYTVRLKSYCHFARNDPNHQCFGVKTLRNSWRQSGACEDCKNAVLTVEMTGHEGSQFDDKYDSK